MLELVGEARDSSKAEGRGVPCSDAWTEPEQRPWPLDDGLSLPGERPEVGEGQTDKTGRKMPRPEFSSCVLHD